MVTSRQELCLITTWVCVDFCGPYYYLEQLGSWTQLSGHWRTGPVPHQPPQWESCSPDPSSTGPSNMAMGELPRASMILELAIFSFIGQTMEELILHTGELILTLA